MEKGYVESFNGRFRDECLNENWFNRLADARENRAVETRLQRSPATQQLQYPTPMEFAQLRQASTWMKWERGPKRRPLPPHLHPR